MSTRQYRNYWLDLTILVIVAIGIVVVVQLWVLRKNVENAIQQQIAQSVLDGRMFLIEHPELCEPAADAELEHFIAKTGGWSRYFLRRNIISTLELLYFQRKSGAIQRAFFVSHCNHIRVWFHNPNFMDAWQRSRTMHVAEFGKFVDQLLASPAEGADPYRSAWSRVTHVFAGRRRGNARI